MKKAYQFLLVLGVSAATLSSCSRANYAVNTTTPTSESVQIAAPASDAAASGTATVSAAMPTEIIAPAREAAAALAHHAPATPAKTAAAVAPAEVVATAAASKAVVTKAERRALRRAAIRQLAAAPKQAAADGKSQTTALILCILLGGIGVHQFYLGYTGRGILRIALALTAFLIVPAIVNLVLYILDIIKIVNGDLKPRNGEYAKTFNSNK